MTKHALTFLAILILSLTANVTAEDGAVSEAHGDTGEPTGRCCFRGIIPEPLLCTVTTEDACFLLANPVSWTEGEDCEGDACNPPTGRCCFRGIIPEPLICTVNTEEACFSLAIPVSWTSGADCGGDPCNCPEDVDGSGTVDFSDLLAVLGAWGPCGGCAEDVDGDSVVGFNDLLALLAAWGPC